MPKQYPDYSIPPTEWCPDGTDGYVPEGYSLCTDPEMARLEPCGHDPDLRSCGNLDCCFMRVLLHRGDDGRDCRGVPLYSDIQQHIL